MSDFFYLVFCGICLIGYLAMYIKLFRVEGYHKAALNQVALERDQLAGRLKALEVTESKLTQIQQHAVDLDLAFVYEAQLKCKLDKLEEWAGENPDNLESLLRGLTESSPGARVQFSSSVSYSSVYNIVAALQKSVTAVRVTARRAPINEDILCKSLIFELLFPWGTVELAGLWTSYKEIRADELFSAVGEFLQAGLAGKMMIMQPGGQAPSGIAITQENTREMVKGILSLTGHTCYIMGEVGKWAEELWWNFEGTTKYRAELAARIAKMDNPPPQYRTH